MKLTQKQIDNTDGFEAFRSLLKEAKLPYEDLDYKRDLLVGYYNGNTLIATGGLEVYGEFALLRSIAVKDSERGRSLGQQIVQDLISRGKSRSVKKIFLLTETAHDFFLRFGFRDTDRSSVPTAVQQSSEFTSVCPVSAACMELEVGGR